MKIGFCQFNVVHKNIEANLNKIKELITDSDTDLIVLPELCFSGYFFRSKEELFQYSDERIQEKIISELQQIAKDNDLYIVAGFAEKEGHNLYNSAIVIGQEGCIGKHRKVNLTINETIFDRGSMFEVINIGKVKIGIVICFESWFPESYRLLSLQGAQIICCPSNFGGPMTPDVLKIRSLENKVYTILANRTGSEISGTETEHFRGESQIIDFDGKILAKAGNEECLKVVDVNPDETIRKDTIICDDMKFEMNKYEKFVKYNI